MAGLNILVPDDNGGTQALDAERNTLRTTHATPTIVTDAFNFNL